MNTMGDILSTKGMFSNMEVIMIHVRGCHEYHGRCSVPWRISSFVI